MSPTFSVARRLLILILLLGPLMAFSPAKAELPRIQIYMTDTAYVESSSNAMLGVFMDNYMDTVAGFSFWLQIDRPDIISFGQAPDTLMDTTYWLCNEFFGEVCLDSTQVTANDEWNFIHVDSTYVTEVVLDTTGSLVAGWEYVEARSLGGFGYDAKIAALANLPAPPIVPGVPPQQGGKLVSIPLNFLDIPDTATERSVTIRIPPYLEHVNFSTPQGQSIGVESEEIVDSVFWLCLAWAGDDCLQWTQVSGPPYDSVEVVLDTIPYLDTNQVILYDATIHVYPTDGCLPGDVNCDGVVNISDLTAYSDYLNNATPLPCHYNGDVNGDCVVDAADVDCLQNCPAQGIPFETCDAWCPGGSSGPCCLGIRGNIDGDSDDLINISDLTFLVTYLFNGGPSPACLEEANVDGQGSSVPNIADLTFLVAYLFSGGSVPPMCP